MSEIETSKRKPRKRHREARNDTLEVRMSTYEKFVIAVKAEQSNMTPSEFVRVAVVGNVGLRRDPKDRKRLDALAPVFQDLDGLTNNVNHIAKALNTTVKIGIAPDEAQATADLSAILGAISDAELRIKEILLAAYV